MRHQYNSIIATFSLVVLVFLSVTYSACKKEPYSYVDNCTGVVCRNNGTCVDGKCNCTAGYTGDFCDIKANAPYIGKWGVTQQVVASNNQQLIGTTKSYEITVTESTEGVTFLSFSGFAGEPSYNATVRIGMAIGFIDVDSNNKTEVDVTAPASNFVFKRYQPLGNSTKQVVKGEGFINGLGTQINGEYYLIYPDSEKGAIEERVSFIASYIN